MRQELEYGISYGIPLYEDSDDDKTYLVILSETAIHLSVPSFEYVYEYLAESFGEEIKKGCSVIDITNGGVSPFHVDETNQLIYTIRDIMSGKNSFQE
ncbi:hypothetical protein NST67_15070 [Bacillus sp. FSL W7-1321]